MKNIYYVYMYRCPITESPLYVGKGKFGRINDHVNEIVKNRKCSTNKRWRHKLSSLLENNLFPKIEKIASELSNDESIKLETSLILAYGRRGYDEHGQLYNACLKAFDWTGVKHSEETKKKISKANKGRKVTQDQKQRLVTMNLGRKHQPRSQQWREKQSLSQTGRKDPNNLNRSLAHLGKNNPRSKTWSVLFPDGSVMKIDALKAWCRERQISFDSLAKTKKLENCLWE